MDAVEHSNKKHTHIVSLSTKITVIVYWFLAIAAFIIAVPLTHHLETNLAERFSYVAERAQTKVQNLLYSDPAPSIIDIENNLSLIRKSLGIKALKLDIDSQPEIISGVIPKATDPDSDSDIASLSINTAAYAHKSIRLVVYHEKLAFATTDLRRKLLLGMGVFFILFGGILAIVLRQIIAKPFLSMVKTAEKFSNGDQDARFDTTSTDEFGYLAHFINKILDQLLNQHNKLKAAHTALEESQEFLSEEKERIEVTLDSISDGVITTDRDGIIEYHNPAATALLGLSPTSTKGKRIEDIVTLIDEKTSEKIDNPVTKCLQTKKIVTQEDESLLYTRHGTNIAISCTVAPIGNNNDVIGTVMILRNVEQNRRLSRQLSYQASHDELTDLFNRRAFEEHLNIALSTAVMDDKCHALFYLDLDQFKIVNDTCGHAAGDALLQQLAEILKSRVRSSDVVARLGGDEFGILLQHCDAEHAEKVASDILKLICNYRFSWDGRIFETGVSIGLALITPDTQTIEQTLSAADMACYVAKENGRANIHVYESNDVELNSRRGEMQWVHRIKDALNNDRFQLYQQSIIDIENNDADLVHFELLLRMIDEDGTVISPMTFIPAAERFQIMPSIDRWVITNAFDYLMNNFPDTLGYLCSINLSGQSLSDDEFMNFVEEMLSSNNISPEKICFEITETAAITHLDKARRFMNALSKMGCKFSLDDFGSGLSSFSYLKDLKVDYLKIDGKFVKDIATNPVDFAMVKSINEIGHIVNLKTIAEFVENDRTLAILRQLGVDFAQGYGIAKPAPLSSILLPESASSGTR